MSRITGFLRVAAIAYALGVTTVAGVYSYANETPNIVYELLVGGILTATLVPQFVRHLQRDDREATNAVVTAAMLALVVVTVLGVILAPFIVDLYTLRVSGPGRAEQQELATKLLRLFMPQMLFYGFTTLATALLQARRRFAAAAFAPILNNVVVIAIFLSIPRVVDGPLTVHRVNNDSALVLLLGLGTTAGVAAMAIALIPALRSARIHLRFVTSLRHAAVRTLVRLSGWTFGYVVANQIALWVVLVLANGVHGGAFAYLSAYAFFQLPHGLFSVSIMTAVGPELAAAGGRGDMAALRHRFARALRLVLTVVIPAAAVYVALARPLVVALLQRGAFSAERREPRRGHARRLRRGLAVLLHLHLRVTCLLLPRGHANAVPAQLPRERRQHRARALAVRRARDRRSVVRVLRRVRGSRARDTRRAVATHRRSPGAGDRDDGRPGQRRRGAGGLRRVDDGQGDRLVGARGRDRERGRGPGRRRWRSPRSACGWPAWTSSRRSSPCCGAATRPPWRTRRRAARTQPWNDEAHVSPSRHRQRVRPAPRADRPHAHRGGSADDPLRGRRARRPRGALDRRVLGSPQELRGAARDRGPVGGRVRVVLPRPRRARRDRHRLHQPVVAPVGHDAGRAGGRRVGRRRLPGRGHRLAHLLDGARRAVPHRRTAGRRRRRARQDRRRGDRPPRPDPALRGARHARVPEEGRSGRERPRAPRFDAVDQAGRRDT